VKTLGKALEDQDVEAFTAASQAHDSVQRYFNLQFTGASQAHDSVQRYFNLQFTGASQAHDSEVF